MKAQRTKTIQLSKVLSAMFSRDLKESKARIKCAHTFKRTALQSIIKLFMSQGLKCVVCEYKILR